MVTNAFSLPQLLWQLFNLLVLLAVFAFLVWRVVEAVRRTKSSVLASAAPAEASLGDAIRAHRTRCKMTQEFVAESLGVSRQAVSKWESGAAAPSTANLMALAELFQVDAAELLQAGKEQTR